MPSLKIRRPLLPLPLPLPLPLLLLLQQQQQQQQQPSILRRDCSRGLVSIWAITGIEDAEHHLVISEFPFCFPLRRSEEPPLLDCLSLQHTLPMQASHSVDIFWTSTLSMFCQCIMALPDMLINMYVMPSKSPKAIMLISAAPGLSG